MKEILNRFFGRFSLSKKERVVLIKDEIKELEQYYETQIRLKSGHIITDFYQDCLDKLREIKEEKYNTEDILKSFAQYIKHEYDLATSNVDVCWKEGLVGTRRYNSMCQMQTWYGVELNRLENQYGELLEKEVE